MKYIFFFTIISNYAFSQLIDTDRFLKIKEINCRDSNQSVLTKNDVIDWIEREDLNSNLLLTIELIDNYLSKLGDLSSMLHLNKKINDVLNTNLSDITPHNYGFNKNKHNEKEIFVKIFETYNFLKKQNISSELISPFKVDFDIVKKTLSEIKSIINKAEENKNQFIQTIKSLRREMSNPKYLSFLMNFHTEKLCYRISNEHHCETVDARNYARELFLNIAYSYKIDELFDVDGSQIENYRIKMMKKSYINQKNFKLEFNEQSEWLSNDKTKIKINDPWMRLEMVEMFRYMFIHLKQYIYSTGLPGSSSTFVSTALIFSYVNNFCVECDTSQIKYYQKTNFQKFQQTLEWMNSIQWFDKYLEI